MADFYENKQVTEEVILVGVALGETSVTDESLDELEELDEVSTSSGFTVLSLSITLPYSSYSTPSLLSDVLSSSLLSVFSSSEESSLSESSSSVYPSSSVYSPSSEISS